jgi:hypothetical protein
MQTNKLIMSMGKKIGKAHLNVSQEQKQRKPKEINSAVQASSVFKHPKIKTIQAHLKRQTVLSLVRNAQAVGTRAIMVIVGAS